tara:strand:- start:267 stop:575 length:309 start_codon:yes stop_codon:yes gene_type:complete
MNLMKLPNTIWTECICGFLWAYEAQQWAQTSKQSCIRIEPKMDNMRKRDRVLEKARWVQDDMPMWSSEEEFMWSSDEQKGVLENKRMKMLYFSLISSVKYTI